jgi:hypothetical protein
LVSMKGGWVFGLLRCTPNVNRLAEENQSFTLGKRSLSRRFENAEF